MPITQVTDHTAQAVAALIEQYKNKPKVVGLLSAFVNRVQDLENAIFPLVNLPSLSASLWSGGENLDLLGRIVGELRNGRGDVSYRTAIQAKILLNSSSGTVEELYAVFALLIKLNGLTCTTQVISFYPKAFSLFLKSAAVPDLIAVDLAVVLKRAKDAGARSMLEYCPNAPLFGFDGSGSGFDTGYFGGTL